MKFFFIFLLVLVIPLLAHPPKGVELEYDFNANILSVEIGHSVNNATKHYVNKVEVEVNGKKVVEQKFKRQVDDEIQHCVYKIIDVAPGDKITVTAFCNISGKKKVDLEVMVQESESGSD